VDIVQRLVEGLLGSQWADEVGFTDLGGSGSASRLSTMVSGFTTYAQRTVVIVDSEGEMAQYVTGLIRSGKLPEEDVLRFKANLEESNFSAEEMLQVLVKLAASPAGGRPPVALTLALNDVLTVHKERCQKTRDKPGLAGTLLKLAEDPKYGGPVTISKPDFALALADRILADLSEAPDDAQAIRACAGTGHCSPSYSTESCPSLRAALAVGRPYSPSIRCPPSRTRPAAPGGARRTPTAGPAEVPRPCSGELGPRQRAPSSLPVS
jgi:hypothetical protein